MKPLDGYNNRFTTDKHWEHVAFRASGSRPIYLQQAELAEVQSIFDDKLKSVGDALLKDGAVIRDASISVDPTSGEVSAASGAIYVRGRVRGLVPATLTIPTAGTITIGVRLIETISTELDDPSLYGPVSGTASYMQQGAARLVVTTSWAHSAETFAEGEDQGEFYPVYTVVNGVLQSNTAPPQIDAIKQALAGYDVDSAGGTYVVSGFEVRQLADAASGEQVYSVGAGRARIRGFAVDLQAASRVIYAAGPDLRTVDSEPFASAGVAAQRVTLARSPVKTVRKVSITAQKTATVVHGSYAGVVDPLPDASVLALVSVTQSGTTFVAGTDYKLNNGQVDWSLPGAEPQPGSSYQVVYQYIVTVTPTNIDSTGFTVEGAVAGTLILTTYDAQLPRYDRLCLTVDGTWTWVTGVAADYRPAVPAVPSTLLPVATVYQSWDNARVTSSDGTRVVPMSTLRSFESRLDYLTQVIAEQALKSDATLRDAALKRGLFVDSLADESKRDAGIVQTAAISNGELILPIKATLTRLAGDVSKPTTLAFTKVPAVEQLRKTGTMKVNPYMSSAIAPANVSLVPAVDFWEQVNSSFTSFETAYFDTFQASFHDPQIGLLAHPHVDTVASVTAQTIARSSTAISTLRSIVVAFTVTGFGAAEKLLGVTFDGVAVATSPATITADASGKVTGVFTIPANIPAGSKAVRFVGSGGSAGSAVFTGQGTLTIESLRQLTVIDRSFYDPLSQTFALSNGEQIASVEVSFASKGASDASLLLRGTDVGLPNSTTYATTKKAVGEIAVNGGFTSFDFDFPIFIDGNIERAFTVMCTDADLTANIAELGKFDSAYGWVTSQPYNIGNLLSSANNSSWVVHPDKDMTFRLMAARYTETMKTIALGTVAVVAATDLIVQAAVDLPDAQTVVSFTLGLPDGTSYVVAPNQPLTLSKAVTGNVTVTATLKGTATRSPVLYPGVTLIAGAQAATANYAGVSFPVGSGSKVVVIYEALIPGGAGVTAAVQGTTSTGAAGTLVAAPAPTSKALDNGYREYVHVLPAVNDPTAGLRLNETGTPAARPRLRNIRAYAVAAS